jgi:hypothetical protein
MDNKIIALGIAIALFVGIGTGYSLSPNLSSNLEIQEYEKSIRSLENDKLELKAVLASTESENTELRETLSNAKILFEEFENQLEQFQTGFGPPDYDSGWNLIDTGEELTLRHGLATTDDLFVYMIGRYFDGLTNQLYYGLCYWGQFEVGCGWAIDDTNIHVYRGEVDSHWDEVRVYIWRIPQGPIGESDSSFSSAPDVKYVEIILSGEQTYDYSRIIDLYGYKDVAITWDNSMENGYLSLWWNARESDGDYLRVGPVFGFDFEGGPYWEDDETGLWRWCRGSDSVKVGGKYLEISIPDYQPFRSPDYTESDTVRIIIYATK